MYRICFRRPDGNIDTEDKPSLASVCGRLPQLAEDHGDIWVRDINGGAIILIYSSTGCLDRP